MAWLRLDTGLLDDDDFGQTTAQARGAYMTAYLLQKRRDGAPFRDHAELCRLLRKEGIADADVLVAEMRGLLESPDPDGPALSIKHYDRYQRDTTSAERQKRYRDRQRELRNDTQHNGTNQPTGQRRPTPRSHASEKPVRFGEAMKEAGLDDAILKKKRQVTPG